MRQRQSNDEGGGTRISVGDKKIAGRIARSVRASCAHFAHSAHFALRLAGRGQWYPCIRRYRIAQCRVVGISLDEIVFQDEFPTQQENLGQI